MRHTFVPCLLALTLLCGCASTQNQEPETIIEERPVERTAVSVFTDDTSGYFAAVAERLRQEDDSLAPSVTTAGENAAEELRTLLLSGLAPNVVWLSPEKDQGIYRALKEDGALRPLDALIFEEAQTLSSLYAGGQLLPVYEGFLSSPELLKDGKVVGLPMTYETAGLLVKEESLKERTVPANFGALLELGEENGPALFGYPQDFPAFLEPFALPYFSLCGGKTRLSSSDWTKEELSSEETEGALLAAAKRLSELSPFCYTAEVQAGLEEVFTAFKEGELLFMPGDEAAIELLQSEYELSSPVRLAAVPAEEGPCLLAAPTSFLYLPAAAGSPGAAMRFVHLALAEEQQKEMAAALGFLPPLKGSPAHLQGYAAQAAEMFENGVTAYCGSFAAGEEEGELFDTFYRSLSQLLEGSLSPEEWAEGMSEALFGEEEPTGDASAAS
ncbi:MAG: ABC transporter substrate-binding protein [Provencibacterium sp.]|nr:ABC transporter substrate-binding protein [Provencibacterium sp.]